MSNRARAAARKILDRFGSQIPVNVDAIVKAHGIEVFEDEGLESFVSGILMIKAGRIGLVINHYHSGGRKRFTIAHELGHYILHKDTSTVFIDETQLFYRGADAEGSIEPTEVEANVFAAELLMPEEAVRADIEDNPAKIKGDAAIRKLAARYDVSNAAMQYRLRQLKLIAG